MIASGSAWVGATVQKVGLDGLPGAEALGCSAGTRSATAPFPSSTTTPPLTSSPRLRDAVGPDRAGARAGGVSGGAPVGPGGAGGATGGATTAVDPMGGLVVKRLLATGESQSACRLATYYNAIQPVTQRFDGFLLIVYAGCGTRIEAAGPGPALESIPEELRAVINILPFGSHLLRPDLARAGVGAQLGNRSPVVPAGTPARHIEPSPVGGRRDGASRWWLRRGARSRMAAGLR